MNSKMGVPMANSSSFIDSPLCMMTRNMDEARTQESKDLIAAGKIDPSDCRNAIFVDSETVQSETACAQCSTDEN
jgi:hypothetical protein